MPTCAVNFFAQAMAKTKKSAQAKKDQCSGKGNADDGNGETNPKETVSIDGIAREWDQSVDMKERLLSGGNPLHPETPVKQEDNNICVLNKDLLVPCLSRMCILTKRPIQTVDDLRQEVTTLLTLSKRTGNDVVAAVETTAQTLKKLLVFVKAKVRRKEVSTVTWLDSRVKHSMENNSMEIPSFDFVFFRPGLVYHMHGHMQTSEICLNTYIHIYIHACIAKTGDE